MSALILGKENIDVIVTELNKQCNNNLIDSILTRIGRILVKENYRSVNYRYNTIYKPKTYYYTPSKDYNKFQVYKTCSCYIYQTCETDNYEKTEAIKIVKGIQENIRKSLNMTEKQIESTEEYEKAEWIF